MSALEMFLDRCKGSVGELEDRLIERQLMMQALWAAIRSDARTLEMLWSIT